MKLDLVTNRPKIINIILILTLPKILIEIQH